MADVRWTDEAVTWLEDIYEYIAEDNPKAAADTVNSIYEKVQILEDFPKAGYLYEKETEKHVRILLYGHYRIAYWIKSKRRIDILGVFHGALDIDQYLL